MRGGTGLGRGGGISHKSSVCHCIDSPLLFVHTRPRFSAGRDGMGRDGGYHRSQACATALIRPSCLCTVACDRTSAMYPFVIIVVAAVGAGRVVRHDCSRNYDTPPPTKIFTQQPFPVRVSTPNPRAEELPSTYAQCIRHSRKVLLGILFCIENCFISFKTYKGAPRPRPS